MPSDGLLGRGKGKGGGRRVILFCVEWSGLEGKGAEEGNNAKGVGMID